MASHLSWELPFCQQLLLIFHVCSLVSLIAEMIQQGNLCLHSSLDTLTLCSSSGKPLKFLYESALKTIFTYYCEEKVKEIKIVQTTEMMR